MPRIGPKLNELLSTVATDGMTPEEVILVAQEVARRSAEPAPVMEKITERYANAFAAGATTEQAARAARSLQRLGGASLAPEPLAQAVGVSLQLFGELDAAGISAQPRLRKDQVAWLEEAIVARSPVPYSTTHDVSTELGLHLRGWQAAKFQQEIVELGLETTPSAPERLERWHEYRSFNEQVDKTQRSANALHTQLGALTGTAQEAVTVLRSRISELDGEISTTESRIQQKSGQVDSLVRQIQQRKSQLETEYENKRNIGILGAFFGYPALTYASLAGMMNDDRRLQQLQSELTSAQRDQASVRAELSAYRAEKSTLSTALSQLQATEGQVSSITELRDNLTAQVGVLTQIRDAARSVEASIDGVVGKLEKQLESVTQQLEKSLAETRKLLELATSDDPQLASINWMKGKVDAQLKAAVTSAVDQALGSTFPSGSPATQILKDELLSRLFQ